MDTTAVLPAAPERPWVQRHWRGLLMALIVPAALFACLVPAVRSARIAAWRTGDR